MTLLTQLMFFTHAKFDMVGVVQGAETAYSFVALDSISVLCLFAF